MEDSRPVYVITFKPEPNTDHVRMVRALLKMALRAFKLKCVRITTTEDEH